MTTISAPSQQHHHHLSTTIRHTLPRECRGNESVCVWSRRRNESVWSQHDGRRPRPAPSREMSAGAGGTNPRPAPAPLPGRSCCAPAAVHTHHAVRQQQHTRIMCVCAVRLQRAKRCRRACCHLACCRPRLLPPRLLPPRLRSWRRPLAAASRGTAVIATGASPPWRGGHRDRCFARLLPRKAPGAAAPMPRTWSPDQLRNRNPSSPDESVYSAGVLHHELNILRARFRQPNRIVPLFFLPCPHRPLCRRKADRRA
jgi:hypothetical protein